MIHNQAISDIIAPREIVSPAGAVSEFVCVDYKVYGAAPFFQP